MPPSSLQGRIHGVSWRPYPASRSGRDQELSSGADTLLPDREKHEGYADAEPTSVKTSSSRLSSRPSTSESPYTARSIDLAREGSNTPSA